MVCSMRTWIPVTAAAGLLAVVPWSSASDPTAACVKAVRIGVAESLCRDTDPRVLMTLIPPFRALAKSCTGLDCDLGFGGDAFPLAERLARGKLELGIFQGIEFAWVRQNTRTFFL